jgi:hypothetical protein
VAAAVQAADEAYVSEVRRWRESREERLKADGGWLTVAGLYWLKPGENRFGTDPGSDIVLPDASAPSRAGVFEHREDGTTTLRLEPGVEARLAGTLVSGPVVLSSDEDGAPDVVEMGPLSLYVIRRGARHAIRLKDKNSAMRRHFAGLRWFPIDESYLISARWVSHAQPRPLRIPNILGETETMPSPGYAEFSLDGKSIRLDGVLEDPRSLELFFIIRDQTSGKETYPAGRFLYAGLPQEGRVVLDFNKAYNPPCAFTAYATCPLPPPQNWMPVRVEAGELMYAKGH